MNESFSFSLGTVNSVASKLMDHAVFGISIDIAKGLCILVIMAYYFKTYLTAYNDPAKGRIGPYDIIRPLLYVIILISYTFIINNMESLAVSFETSVISSIGTAKPITESPKDDKKPEENSDNKPGPLEIMATNISSVMDTITHPENILLKILDFLASILSSIVFVVALIARAAALFILKFVGPFAIVASIFEAYRTYFFNWLKVYALVYASVFVFFVINLFCDTFQSELWSMKSATSLPIGTTFISATYTLILLAVTICKITLYSKSVSLMKSAFTSA